jgi:hypothetical protein
MSALLTPDTVRLIMGIAFFPMGLFSIGSGLYILIRGPYRQEAKILAEQSARISQKGLTGDISLVAQSATALVDAVNNLIRTSSGNAIMLVVIGGLCELAAFWLLVVLS